MATLKKYDISGNEIGLVEVDNAFLKAKAHPQSVKDYIVAIRNNARQWSACTKTRAEINRTGKKPHPQKGGGRSRQGDLAAPHYKGGGIVFGPRPKFDVHTRINKKERRAAIASLIIEKIKENRIHILQKEAMTKPQTKMMAHFFEKMRIGSQRALVLGMPDARGLDDPAESKIFSEENLVKSLRNLPKKEYSFAAQVNGYSLARCQHIVVLESALDQFLSILGAFNG